MQCFCRFFIPFYFLQSLQVLFASRLAICGTKSAFTILFPLFLALISPLCCWCYCCCCCCCYIIFSLSRVCVCVCVCSGLHWPIHSNFAAFPRHFHRILKLWLIHSVCKQQQCQEYKVAESGSEANGQRQKENIYICRGGTRLEE